MTVFYTVNLMSIRSIIKILSPPVISQTSSKSKKIELKDVEISITKLKYIEALWLQRLLNDLGFSQKKSTPIYIDNQSIISLYLKLNFYLLIKSIKIQYYFTYEVVQLRQVQLQYLSTSEMIVDTFTMSVHWQKHH